MNFSFENTVLLASKNIQVNKLVKDAAKEIGLSVYKLVRGEDIAAVPYRMIIIDQKNLNNHLQMEYLEGNLKFYKPSEVCVCFLGETKSMLPIFLRKHCILISMKTDFVMLLESKFRATTKIKNESSVKSRVKRIVKIYSYLVDGKNELNEEEFCKTEGISKRTLQRDIKLLKEIGIDIYYDGLKKVYYTPDRILRHD